MICPSLIALLVLGKRSRFPVLCLNHRRPFLNINNGKWLQKGSLSTLKRPGCSVVRLVETRDSPPLNMFFISGCVEENAQLKKGLVLFWTAKKQKR